VVATLLFRWDRPAVVDVRGRDAQAFLHRMLTQDVRSMPVGGARRACLLTREGRVTADMVVWRFPDRLRLVLAADAAAKAVPALERYVIADDVAFAGASSEWGILRLVGPAAGEALAARGVVVPEAGTFVEARLGTGPALVLRRDLGERAAFEILTSSAEATNSWIGFLGRGPVAPGDDEAFDVARIETGVAAWGAEIDERVMPNEAGLEDAVSWTKGCYLGQEPVVMARHRGHPPSLLVRLSVSGDDVPARETALLDGDRRVGRVTTAGRGAVVFGVVALGFVRHADARVGATFALDRGAGTATVAAVLAR
jgi:folate-binding protein YgfZ